MKPRNLTEGERMNAIATRGITSYAELVAKQATIHVAANVTVSWAWYDQANGVVVWKFQNSDTKQHSVVLLRNGDYFGGDWLDGSKDIAPLNDNGILYNAPPLGLVTFGNSNPQDISTKNTTVCFIFTLAPRESWSMLEGGFSQQMTPSGISLYEVTPLQAGNYCIGYDQQRVLTGIC